MFYGVTRVLKLAWLKGFAKCHRSPCGVVHELPWLHLNLQMVLTTFHTSYAPNYPILLTLEQVWSVGTRPGLHFSTRYSASVDGLRDCDRVLNGFDPNLDFLETNSYISHSLTLVLTGHGNLCEPLSETGGSFREV